MRQYWLFLVLICVTVLVIFAAGTRVWQVAQQQAPATPTSTDTAGLAAPTVSLQPTTSLTPPAAVATVATTPTATVVPFSPTVTAVPASPTATATAMAYLAYRVQKGDDLVSIAKAGNSDPAYITSYNRLNGEPQPLRPLIVPQLSANPTLVSQAIIVQRGANRPAVALTLDAGASSEPTAQMLATLAEYDVRITFFLTGDWIQRNPELTRQIVAAGHEIANHSVTHPDFRNLDDTQIAAELNGMADILYQTTGIRPAPYFRPPYGAYDERVLRAVAARGYIPIFWTLDSLDSVGEPKSAEFIVERLTTTLNTEKRNGAILLAHCGSQSTADALPAILEYFSSQGIVVTTLSQIL
jgi:peptidoglycan/xylan/chitin deacetylase (PgdA/CDA1 family)